jgi:hypothetical protein
MRQLERGFVDAIIHQDSTRLEQFLASDYTLRVAVAPEASAPRAFWLDNALHKSRPRSAEDHNVVARRLDPNLAVVSFIHRQTATFQGRDFSGRFYLVDLWRQNSKGWQLAARYSSAMGPRVRPGGPTPPPPADIDAQLTDTLAQLERELGDVALHGFKDRQEVERLVGSEFTVRFSDAPERSVPRAHWALPSTRYKMEALEEQFPAARRLADDLAVVSLLLTEKVSLDGRDQNGDSYLVDIWKRRADRWQLIARYSGRLSATSETAPHR